MARTKRWTDDSITHGIKTVTLTSWKYFHDFFQEELLDFKNYVFRGQSEASWKLEPTLNRFLAKKEIKGQAEFEAATNKHLNNFKFSIRGRTHDLHNIINDENELWALGQHHGLHTPFLDFTFSPYVAAYFAFQPKETQSKHRIIYGLSQYAINNQINQELELYRPLSGHNDRLLSQSGLFVKFKALKHLEEIINSHYEKDEKKRKLFIIKLPNKDREVCLKFLNRMNINHNTLFPDLSGSSIYCNTELEIKNY